MELNLKLMVQAGQLADIIDKPAIEVMLERYQQAVQFNKKDLAQRYELALHKFVESKKDS
jgi:hypothetical protein